MKILLSLLKFDLWEFIGIASFRRSLLFNDLEKISVIFALKYALFSPIFLKVLLLSLQIFYDLKWFSKRHEASLQGCLSQWIFGLWFLLFWRLFQLWAFWSQFEFLLIKFFLPLLFYLHLPKVILLEVPQYLVLHFPYEDRLVQLLRDVMHLVNL